MKILHVVDQISQEVGGGGAKVAYELAHAQAKLGHDVSIYTSDFNSNNQKSSRLVRLVKYHSWFTLAGVLYVPPGLLFASYDFDIVHLHNYRTIVNVFVALRAGNIVLQAHGNSSPIKRKFKPLYDCSFRHLVFNKAKHYIADAEAEIPQYIVEGATKDKISIIPVGINLNEFKRLPERENHPYKTIVYLGRLHRLKGADLLVDAVSCLSGMNVRLHIIGPDYGYKDTLQKQVHNLGIDNIVTFYDRLSRADVLKELVDADVFVMPSRYEMWGIAFMEALACGTPVVMTENCEASKLLLPQCGLVSKFDKGHLAVAIGIALDEELVKKYRRYRREWASQFSWDKIAVKHIELYWKLVDE